MQRVVAIDIASAQSTYAREKDGWFHVTEERTEMSMVVLDALPGAEGRKVPDVDFVDSVTETSTEVPDRSIGEFDKMRVLKEDGKVFLESKVRTAVAGGEMADFGVRAEIEFTSGDWFDYEAGTPVEFRYTDSGLEHAKRAFGEQLEKVLSPMLRTVLLEDLKAWKAREEITISDADLGRLAYVETEIDFPRFANTVYTYEDDEISYAEKDSARIQAIFGIGVSAEDFKSTAPAARRAKRQTVGLRVSGVRN